MSTSNSMDPFDEFEFKPLTDGLGFHKKAVHLQDGLKSSGVIDDSLQSVPPVGPPEALMESAPLKKHSFEDVLSALEKTPLQRPADLEFTEVLPREALEIDMPRPVQSPFPKSETYKSPIPAVTEKKKMPAPAVAEAPSVGIRRGAADSPKAKALEAATFSLPSAFLDFVIVAALSLIFLVALLTVTKVDLGVVVTNLGRDLMTQLSLGLMFIAVMQMYVVISRSFFGCTMGEWTFDYQVGEDGEQKRESYPLRIALRSLITTLTGLILLPVVSAIMGRDIAGSVSGVKLYRQRVG